MYDPLIHKKPVGAVCAGEKFEITFPTPTHLNAYGVSLFVLEFGKGEEHTMCFPLEKKNTKNDVKSGSNIDKTASQTSDKTNAQTTVISDGQKDTGDGVDSDFDIFEGSVIIPKEGIYGYRFEAYADEGTIFFGRSENGTAVRGDWLPMWQLTVTKPHYKTPDYAKSGVIYHIFADRFYKADDVPFLKEGRLHADWYDAPDIADERGVYLANDFFGGDIKGIIEKLDYLESLSVSIIYLSPIFESYSNHRYDTGDYLKIDPLLGTEKDFGDLVAEAKKRGIEIMLDGVFNHTGSDSVYFNKKGTYKSLGAYQSKDSPYFDWYSFDHFPDTYKCWWGVTVVPTVNKESKSYRDFILGKGGVIDKWTKLGIGGWRLDVVDELPQDFVDEIRKTIKDINKDCLLIGEVWEDASTKVSYGTMRPYLLGSQLDGVMNYPFKTAILDFVLTSDSTKFRREISVIVENYPKASLDVSMTLIGTHDTVRALTALSPAAYREMSKNQKQHFKLSISDRKLAVKRLMLAAVLQYTLPGIPSLYYGDEAGLEGFSDPLNRAAYPWGKEDRGLVKFYQMLGRLRKENKEVFSGGLRFLHSENGVICFERYVDTAVESVNIYEVANIANEFTTVENNTQKTSKNSEKTPKNAVKTLEKAAKNAEKAPKNDEKSTLKTERIIVAVNASNEKKEVVIEKNRHIVLQSLAYKIIKI